VSSAPSNPLGPPPNKRWRRWGFRALLAIVALALIAPRLIGDTPLRNFLLGVALRDARGTLTCDSASLGWFSPISFRGVQLQDDRGETIASIDSIQGNTALWRIALLRDDLGRFEFRHPAAHIVIADDGSNFSRVFQKKDDQDKEEETPPADNPLSAVPPVSVALSVVDAEVSLERVAGPIAAAHALHDPSRWVAKGIQLTAGIRRSPQDPAESILFVEPGRLIDRAAINRDVSAAWLQYIAPLLAGATQSEGSFSIDLDEWRVPLSAPRQARLGGALTLHHLDVSPGPVGQAITEFLRLPPSIVASDDTTVRFHMSDEVVRHEGMRLLVGGLPVVTHGAVGLDQTLDIVAEVTLPEFDSQDAPVRNALSGRQLVIPIRGTLAKPEVDAQSLANSGIDLLNDVLANLGQRLPNTSAPPSGEEIPVPDPNHPNAAAVDWQSTINQAIPLVQEALRRRRERQQQAGAESATSPEASTPENAAVPDTTSPEAPPGQRPFRRRVRRLLDVLTEPAPAEQPPPK